MGALQLTLTDKGERRLLASALGRFNRNPHLNGSVSQIYKWGSLKLRLFKNDHTVSKSTINTDLTEVDAAGYSEIDITPIDFVRKTADSDTTNTVYSKEYTFNFTGSGDVYGAMISEADATTAATQVETITAEADSSGSLSGTYWTFYAGEGLNTLYYVWYDTGGSSNPSVPNATGIQVEIEENDTANTIGDLTRTTINDAGTSNVVTGSDAEIILTRSNAGAVTSNVSDNNTGWSSFVTNTEGAFRFYAGTNEATKLVCTAGTSLGGKWFGFTTPANDGNNYPIFIWYNTGSDSAPTPSGYALGIPISINTGDTAAEVATKTATAIQSGPFAGYGIIPMIADGDTLYIESIYPSAVDALNAGDTGFTLTQLIDSSNTGVTWFAGNFASPLSVVDGDDIKITLQLTIN